MWPFARRKTVFETLGVGPMEYERTKRDLEEHRMREIVRDELQKQRAAEEIRARLNGGDAY